MNKLDKVATEFYEVAKDYKKYFCKLKTNLKEKNNIEKYLIGFYNYHQLYNFVKEDKDNSIKEIKKFITDNYGIMTLYNIIESNITSTEDLDNIDTIYKFLYDVMSLEECCDIAIKKYGNKYKRYCNLYIRMQKIEKDLLDYLKEIYKEN